MTRALFALVLALAGCGGGSVEVAIEHPDAVAWLQRYGPWMADYRARVDAVENSLVDTSALRTCTDEYDANVGVAPQRFRPVERLVRAGCAAYERAASLHARITPRRDPAPLLLPIQTALARGDHAFGRAAYALELRLHSARELPVEAKKTDDSHIDPRLGAAAETIVHQPVEVRCWSERDWDRVNEEQAALGGDADIHYAGFVGTDASRIHLAPSVCAALARLVYDRAWTGRDEVEHDDAFAVLALAHEANHLLGPAASEAEVECSAIQQVRPLARALGIGAAYSDRAAETAWEEIYAQNEPRYRTRECRDGGRLDLNPRTSRWP